MLWSTGVKSHLCGFITSESACDAPSKMWAMFSEQRGGSGIGSVDVKPETVFPGDRADFLNGVDAGSGRESGPSRPRRGLSSCGEILRDHRGERLRAHAEFVIGSNVADVLETDAGGQCAAIDGGMRVLGSVQDQGGMFAGEANFRGASSRAARIACRLPVDAVS